MWHHIPELPNVVQHLKVGIHVAGIALVYESLVGRAQLLLLLYAQRHE